jgi:hypothetical protein
VANPIKAIGGDWLLQGGNFIYTLVVGLPRKLLRENVISVFVTLEDLFYLKKSSL